MARGASMLLALVAWSFAIVGAAGVAYWLKLSSQHAILLIAAVAVIAFFGSFLSVLRLGKS